MITIEHVDTIGMIAGAIWMSTALYFHFIRTGRVQTRIVTSVFLIGVSIMLGSTAIVMNGSSFLIASLALIGNIIFSFLGVAIWISLARNPALELPQHPK